MRGAASGDASFLGGLAGSRPRGAEEHASGEAWRSSLTLVGLLALQPRT